MSTKLPTIDIKGGETMGPIFRIVGDSRLSLVTTLEMNELRPCEHRTFVLDERWNTVHCGKCKEKLEPFICILRYAEWWNEIVREREHTEIAEIRLLGADIRLMSKRRIFTDVERETWGRKTQSIGKDSLTELRELHETISTRVRESKRERRQSKRLSLVPSTAQASGGDV